MTAAAHEEDRQRALAAARCLLTARGIRDLKVETVLREAGLSTRAFYRHFGNKHDLVRALIEQSSRDVAERTRARARKIGLELVELDAWYDVDDADALRTVHAELCADISFAADLVPHRAENTAALLHDLIDGTDLLERLPTERAGVVERAAE